MTETGGAAYVVDGSRVHPTDRARGPWLPDQQHGAAVVALLARFLEQVPSRVPMRFTRITVDMSRAVPMTDVSVETQVHRDGARVQSVAASIVAGGDTVARATATRLRVEPGLVPAEVVPALRAADAAPPFDGTVITYGMEYTNFHDCLEVRRREGTDEAPAGDGPDHQTWYRLASPLVAGEAPSPIVRMAAAADMLGSAAMRLGPGWMSINPEVMLEIDREPAGEWVCAVSTVRFGDDGIGMSSGVLFDRSQRVGASAKTLLNTHR